MAACYCLCVIECGHQFHGRGAHLSSLSCLLGLIQIHQVAVTAVGRVVSAHHTGSLLGCVWKQPFKALADTLHTTTALAHVSIKPLHRDWVGRMMAGSSEPCRQFPSVPEGSPVALWPVVIFRGLESIVVLITSGPPTLQSSPL